MRNSYYVPIQPLLAVVFAIVVWNSAVAQSIQKSAQTLNMSARFNVESGTDKGFLIVKIEIPTGSHIYSLTQKSPLLSSKLTVKKSNRLVVAKPFKADKKPKVIENDPVFQIRVEKHTGTVQFFVPIKIDTSVNLKSLHPVVELSGQICSDQGFCKLINKKTVQAQFAGFFQREAKSSLPTIKEK